VDELTKLVKSLSAEMEKLKFEGKQGYRNTQNTDNRGNFRRPNNSPQIIQRDQRNRDRDDKKIQAPLQNNLVTDEEGEEEETDPEIHCLGDTSSSPHLTQSAYEESLMDSQLNELSKGERTSGNPNRYNLRSKKKEGSLTFLINLLEQRILLRVWQLVAKKKRHKTPRQWLRSLSQK
jgi:hypothetical protein